MTHHHPGPLMEFGVMEVLLSEPIDLERVADLCAVGLKREPSRPRDRSSWHISNLIASAYEVSRGNNAYHEYQGAPSGIMSMGRIWESAVDCYLADWSARKGGVYCPDMEYEQDGIIGSLDGLMVLPELGILVCESKLRFSLGEDIPLKHLQQVRAYCYLATTDRVCYVSGHLSSTPPTARALLRLLRVTRESVEETWEMLVNTKKYLESVGCGPEGMAA